MNPLAPTHANEFRHDAVYETLVDTNGDAKPNIAFRYRFSRKENGKQFAHVTRVELARELEDGHLEDRSQLQPGENHQVELVIDRARGVLQAPFGSRSVMLTLV